jgi:hypothetical protein
MPDIVPQETIENRIHLLRGKKVMIDHDLAALYGVTTGNFNKAVQRNIDRFPEDFMFQLTRNELKNLIFQFGISRWGGDEGEKQNTERFWGGNRGAKWISLHYGAEGGIIKGWFCKPVDPKV